MELCFHQMDEAIQIMREVAAWGRGKGFRVWKDEWLTKEALLTDGAQPENFCVGKVNGESACAFLLLYHAPAFRKDGLQIKSPTADFGNQMDDQICPPDSLPTGATAAYLHKFCVRRKFAHQNMTQRTLEALREFCKSRGIRVIRLDTGLDEKAVRKIYLNAGFVIVDILDHENGRSTALYEYRI